MSGDQKMSKAPRLVCSVVGRHGPSLMAPRVRSLLVVVEVVVVEECGGAGDSARAGDWARDWNSARAWDWAGTGHCGAGGLWETICWSADRTKPRGSGRTWS